MGKAEGGLAGLIRGKVGGNVFYVVNGQQRVRELTPVFNPQTPRQTEIRIINTELSRQWRDDLNQGQRTAWEQRAETLGTKGELLYIKQNFPLLDFGLQRQLTPPPLVFPPELFDLLIFETVENLTLQYPQLAPAIITAQTPFLDIEIAGGFTSVSQELEPPIDPAINTGVNTQALSQGRKHQNSDFRHAAYAQDQAIGASPEPNNIVGIIPDGTIRNIVFRVKRINKFGNATAEKVIEAVITAPAL